MSTVEEHEAEQSQITAEYEQREQAAIAVLVQVKARLGRRYKAAISGAWMTGNYADLCLTAWASQLQNIRNQFGPEWLAAVKVR